MSRVATDPVQKTENKVLRRTSLVMFPVILAGAIAMGWVPANVPSVNSFFAGLPTWLATVIMGVFFVAVCLIAVPVYRLFNGHATTVAEPTPAELWAQANGWDYRLTDDRLDDAIWQTVVDQTILVEASDIVHGQHDGREAWAFAFDCGSPHDHSHSVGQAVVLKLKTAWPGRFEASQTRKRLSDFDGEPQDIGGWFIDAELPDGETHDIVGYVRRIGLGNALAEVRLAADAVVRAQDDDGRYVGVLVDWAVTPDADLPRALDALTPVADALEQAQERAAGFRPAEPGGSVE